MVPLAVNINNNDQCLSLVLYKYINGLNQILELFYDLALHRFDTTDWHVHCATNSPISMAVLAFS